MLGAIFSLCCLLQSPPATATSSVEIVVSDEFGAPLPFSVQSFKQFSSHPVDLASRFNNLRAQAVPPGLYSLTLSRKDDPFGSGAIRRDVVVKPSHTVLHFYAPKEFSSGVAADGATPWNHRFAIHLQGLSKAHYPARIKLLPATNGPVHECFIDPAGLCQLPNSVRGLYVLAVVSGSKVLYLEPLSIQGNTAQHEITLTLPRNAPPIRVLP